MIDYIYLSLQNPWWENKHAVSQDDKIREFDSLKYQYIPADILNLPFNNGDIHVVSGPRQTGKSTAIKLYIRDLLKSNFSPLNILYFNCDALSDHKELSDFLIEYHKQNNGHQTKAIFLDEISSIDNWPQAVKWLAYTGLLKNSCLFLTGSSGINLKKSGELLPGRRGKGKDVSFLPVSFYDYLHLVKELVPKIALRDPKAPKILAGLDHKIKNHYNKFLQTGGFLRNINYGLTEPTNDLYLKTVKSELFKA